MPQAFEETFEDGVLKLGGPFLLFEGLVPRRRGVEGLRV